MIVCRRQGNVDQFSVFSVVIFPTSLPLISYYCSNYLESQFSDQKVVNVLSLTAEKYRIALKTSKQIRFCTLNSYLSFESQYPCSSLPKRIEPITNPELQELVMQFL